MHFHMGCRTRICRALCAWYRNDPRHELMNRLYAWCPHAREWKEKSLEDAKCTQGITEDAAAA